MNQKRRQITIHCKTIDQFRRMVEWAKFLGLEWNYGRGLGKLKIGQGVFPRS